MWITMAGLMLAVVTMLALVFKYGVPGALHVVRGFDPDQLAMVCLMIGAWPTISLALRRFR